MLKLNIIFVIILLSSKVMYSQWSTDPNVNNPICTAVNDQTNPIAVNDDSGGAIIVWADTRNGSTNSDIYAHRIDVNGITRWTMDGVIVCSEADYQLLPAIVSDGSGGAIIVWVDNRYGNNYDIYSQRIDANGLTQWAPSGVEVCTAVSYQSYPTIVSDESGGAIIIWQDKRSGLNYDMYAQRIDANGLTQWAENGVAICLEVGPQENPMAISDGNGGVITTWNDSRGSSYDIYAQLIDSNGVVQWTTNGVEICTAPWEQSFVTLTDDGSGGAIITWEDRRNPPVDIYAQHIDASGVAQWTVDGITISTLAYDQVAPAIISDGNNGAIITMQVNSTGNDYDIYVQRVNADGLVQWSVNGMSVCTADHNQQDPAIISDGNGGAIITWEDQRSGTNYDIYAQQIDADGLAQWTIDGETISTATYDQIFPAEVSDGDGGAIIIWQDYRVAYPDSVDIYAQRVDANGNLGIIINVDELPTILPDFVLQQNYPNPFNPSTKITYSIPHKSFVTLEIFDPIGSMVSELVNEFKEAGSYELDFNASELSSGVYFYKIEAGGFTEIKKMVLLR